MDQMNEIQTSNNLNNIVSYSVMNRTGDNEILRHKKELIQCKSEIADLKEELEEKTNLYINAIKDRDTFKERLNGAKDSINRVENIVQSKVTLALDKERKELSELREQNALLKQRLELLDGEKTQMGQRERQLMDKINGLTQDLAFYARNVDTRESMKRIDILREEKESSDRRVADLLKELNDISNKMEDMMAENRTLRQMANVPKNYGINLEQIKLHDRDKIDDYKKLIRVLQEDNYKLEEERAKLKHQLKQQSMLYKQEPSQRYKGLTQEQIFKVDQYVLKLLAGDTEEPADYYKIKKENQILRAQLDALNSKGFDFAKGQMEVFLKELGLGDSSKAMEKLVNGNEELKKLLRDLLQKGITASSTLQNQTINSGSNFTDLGKFRPPVPQMGFDGEVSQGYSYKFQTHLEVADKDGRPGLGDAQTKYDVAFLQLQLQETLELIKRKDENLTNQQNEIDVLYRRVRGYLLTQDQLYKDYVKMEKEFNEKKTKNDQDLRNARDSVLEEQLKVKNLENVCLTLQKGSKESIEYRIIEYTKQNSILDINLLRLTRKYQTLVEQEEILRREYHNKESDMAEKDVFVQDRINKLKEWKARAIQQLTFLFKKLRLAVPLSEFQSSQSENDLFKQKIADYIERNAKMSQKLSKLQTKVRENMEAEEKLRNLMEIKDDLSNEFDVIRKRLELLDSGYKWENAVFNKIVTTLKRVKVSPQQAFEEFDVNKDGKLTREEFSRALEMLKISDLSQQEIDILMGSIDVDSDGYIRYKEFIRKLQRHGIHNRTSEEQIIYLIVDALKKSRVKSLSEAFEIIDKEGRGVISREEFKDIFKNLNIKISESDIDKFIDHFWKDKVAGIDYQEFLRIFNRYQVRLDEDEKNSRKVNIAFRIPDDILRLKKRIYMEMSQAFKKAGKSLKGLFSKVDVDGSNQIDKEEFNAMFTNMGLKLTPLEIENIFNSVDFDLSGNITFPEFHADFDKVVKTDIQTLLIEEKDRVQAENNSMSQQNYGREDIQKMNNTIAGGARQNSEMQMQTRIAILESREKQLNKRLETSMRILNHSQQSQQEMTKSHDNLEKQWNELTESYHKHQERIRELEEQMKKSIKKDEAERLKDLNEKLITELTETRAAMLSYKNMTEVIGDQVKGLKLQMERKKDENENLVTALRDLESMTEDSKRIGKLYYLIMLSRWQEAAVNKKYDMILSENKELRKEIINHNQLYENKEYDHHECENLLQEQQLQLEKLKKEISSSRNIFLTLEKAQELDAIIVEVTDEKSELEEYYFKLRTEFLTTQVTMDEACAKSDHLQELLDTLQKSKPSELSDKLIELSEKLSTIRLGELRATRESGEMKEKNNYLSRLLKQQNDQLRKLEEKSSDFESKIHKREEEFRKADNERMKRFFNARFDDVPGALGGQRPSGFSENLQGYQRKKQTEEQSFTRQQSNREELLTGGINSANLARQGTVSINGQDKEKFLESKIKKLQEELKSAVEEIRNKEQQMKRLANWQLEDKFLSEDEVMRDIIEKSKNKTTSIHEQESKEMAQAASQMVLTLQGLLDQKNEMLKNKEAMIDSLRKQMMAQREQDGIEIARLQQNMSLAAGNTLSKLQEIVVKNEHSQQTTTHNKRYDRLTREELSKALDEKDHVIQNCSAELKGLQEKLKYSTLKKKEIEDKLLDVEQELRHEKEKIDLKQKNKELERVRKELTEKDKMCQKLKGAIDDLNDRMQKYEAHKSDATEDMKMVKVQEDAKKREYDSKIKTLQDKLTLTEGSRNQRNEEFKELKVKVEEQKENEKKLRLEIDEYQKSLKNARDKFETETRERQKLQIENGSLRTQIQVGKDVSTGLSYEALLNKTKELEKDNLILQMKQKTVVVYNKEVGTFEYIGEPIFLNNEREVQDIDELITQLESWLERNDKITLSSIFESQDKQNYGELNDPTFEKCLNKAGIKLRAGEKRMLKDYLDPKNIGFLKYKPLVREIARIPQLDFIAKEILKVAKLYESRDLEPAQFKLLVDKDKIESMNSDTFLKAMKTVNNDQFNITDDEINALFKVVTKSKNVVGVNISIQKLLDKVLYAVDGILIEKMKDAVSKSMKSLIDLMMKHDLNKDGNLEYVELENLLLECQLAFKPKMLQRVYGILDPNKKGMRINFNTFKFFLGDTNVFGGHSAISRSLDYEPSMDRAKLSEETTNEEMNLCRSGARKILTSFQNNLTDILGGTDINNEGIVSREEVQKVLSDQKIADLQPAETHLLLKYMDKNTKGYIAIDKLIEKLQDLAVETKLDSYLRTFALNVKRQGINLKQELTKYDTQKLGRLEKKTFGKAISQMPVTVTEEGISLLSQVGELPEIRGFVDLRTFIDKVIAAQKQKALPNFMSSKQHQQMTTSIKPSGKTSGAFENWEAEKKYKTKLQALQQQIEESKKETQDAEKQTRHWQEMANRFEKEKNSLQSRLVDINAKPPKAAAMESLNQGQLENMQQLKDNIFYLQEENQKLAKSIQVELKAEIAKMQREQDKMIDKIRNLTEENKRLEHQVNRLIGKPMDQLEKREEGELWRDIKIQDLEKELELRDKKESDQLDYQFQMEQKLLDLKFQKETFDLQFSRLQKRITDLEQYKLASSKYSAVIKGNDDAERNKIEDVAGTIGGLIGGQMTQKKNDDTVRLRSKGSKSIAELEMLVESLKRVIEKQKTENDALKENMNKIEKQGEKLKSEKQLRQKIETLEQVVHSHEMRDVNVEEKDKTIKKLIEANRGLKEDLKREEERFSLLESKYKDILVKYNVLAKEHAKNSEMLFAMNTGGNIHNYSNYLMEEGKDSKSKSKPQTSFADRNFEDVF